MSPSDQPQKRSPEPPLVESDATPPRSARSASSNNEEIRSDPQDAATAKRAKLLNSRPTIFLTLFCVTGFLGIPLLWLSRAFSTVEKIVWSVVVTIYTYLLIWITYRIVMWSYNNISNALGW